MSGKYILHCDMNNYYASVECISNDELRRVPMAVCGDPSTRHGIVLSKNDIAKKLGILTGESVYSAKQKVPHLRLVQANYNKYVHYANLARDLYKEYSDDIIPYGLDEAWIVTRAESVSNAAGIADNIRENIKKRFNLTASVGVSYNYIFSKLASDMKKPDATTVLDKGDLETVIWNLPAFDMLFVGPATRQKLKNMNILTIGDIAGAGADLLKRAFGKNGVNLWQFANGNDSSFDPHVPADNPFKSFGNTITLPKDITDTDDILAVYYVLTKAVVSRMKKHTLTAGCIGINLKYNDFKAISRQITIPPTDNVNMIFMNVKRLFDTNYKKKKPIRSLGVHVSGFADGIMQLSLFDNDGVSPDADKIITNLKAKVGDFNLERTSMSSINLTDINEFILLNH